MNTLFPIFCDGQDWTNNHKYTYVLLPHDHSKENLSGNVITEYWSKEKIMQHFK